VLNPTDSSETPHGGGPTDDTPRPQTSTRDLGELRDRLVAWLTRQLPPGADPRVSEFDVPDSNGLSSETVLFDLTWRDGDATRVDRLVARLAPMGSAVPVFPTYDLERQYRALEGVATLSSVPVPHVRWLELDAGPLGSPFFVMDRIDGQVPPDLMPYNIASWLTEATPEQRDHLQDATVQILADLHAIPDPTDRFAFLAPAGTGSLLERNVAEQWAYYEWVSAGTRQPLLERCFEWLRAHWPAEEGAAVLSWGDSRIGNVIYRDFEPVAVLDWEMATLGPPELDLGWLIFLHRFFQDVAAQFELPGLPDFLRRDEVAARYEALTGHTPHDLDFYTMYAALRHGIIMSRIQQRAIHFGEAEAPDDPDDLITHRATLEAMLDGGYWSQFAPT
jgi:aminoglycoside phosphotransferase (APT) family kinase protein